MFKIDLIKNVVSSQWLARPHLYGLARARSLGLAAFVPLGRDKFLSPFPKRLESLPQERTYLRMLSCL
jgi:hypothetical protein